MFPSRGDLHVAPFTDEALYMEQINKVNFWYQDYFHGVNLGCLRDAAMKEYFRQPIVRTKFISIFNDYIGNVQFPQVVKLIGALYCNFFILG